MRIGVHWIVGVLAGGCAGALLLAGCGADTSSNSSSTAASRSTVTVFAAASLTEAFTTMGKQYETAHPGVTVRFNFGASSALALSINGGQPADVFASASPKNMQQVVAARHASAPTTFARNRMAIVVPPANPGHVTSVADLADRKVSVALCQPQVPCGATAREVLTRAGVSVKPVTLEEDVKATLTKVRLDEVDAGIVYLTDARAAGAAVHQVSIPDSVNASTAYPIAALTPAANAAGATGFVNYVLSPAGRAVLTADGFSQP